MGAQVSVAELRTKRPLTIVNCSGDERRLILRLSEPNAAEREREVWQDIDYAFSKPVTQQEHTADYVPTQVLAEFFRSHGLDGLGYRSSVGPGSNIAFFHLDSADVVACGLFQVRSVTFTSIEASEPYFIRKELVK